MLHRDALLSCAYPIPLKKRPRPPVLPDSADPTRKYAVCQISDVYEGWDGVPRGAVKYLRISQRVGWPLDDKIGAMRWIPGEAYQTHYGFWSWRGAGPGHGEGRGRRFGALPGARERGRLFSGPG